MYSPRAHAAVGAMFGTPDSARYKPGDATRSNFLHNEEVKALNTFQLPAPVLTGQPSFEFNKKQRDEPTEDQVWQALHQVNAAATFFFCGGRVHASSDGRRSPLARCQPPAKAPSQAVEPAPERFGNVLQSPRRVSVVGQTCHHASEWRQAKQTFELSTPYPMATNESRFADAAADRAALAAVAYTAGQRTVAPAAGTSSNRQNTFGALPSMRAQMMHQRG